MHLDRDRKALEAAGKTALAQSDLFCGLKTEAWETRQARGLAKTEHCHILQLIKGYMGTESGKNYQGDTNPLGSRKKSFQTLRRTDLPPEQGKMAAQGRGRRGGVLLQDSLCCQKILFSQGSLLLKSPPWSGFCLTLRPSGFFLLPISPGQKVAYRGI